MAKQTGKQETLPVEASAPRPVATTYYAKRAGKQWEVYRLEVLGDGTYRPTRVLEHPDMLVARNRLEVLLNSPEVLP